MIVFLPDPQEVAYSEIPFVAGSREKLFLAPWQGDDALEEVLLPALRKALGKAPAVETLRLSGARGATLALARDAGTAAALARDAAIGLGTPVATATVWRDGPCMPGEASSARRIPVREQGLGRDETYCLIVDARGVAIAGSGRRGLFWGVQTLCQALRAADGRRVPGLRVRDWPTQEVRGVHLDMKYFYQKPAAIETWLKGLAALKLNCALFEYEDKYPFRDYPSLHHRDTMSPTRLRKLLDVARRYHIDIVPLVQSLGHLEFALKHDEFAGLREAPDIYTQACPTNPASFDFVRALMDDVLDCHADAPFFHIGGDETGFLGECPRCAEVVKKSSAEDLYLDHIVKVLDHVISRGKRPILWEDIVRVRPETAARIPRETILAYWDYGQRREAHHERKMNPTLAKLYGIEGRPAAEWADTLSYFEHFDHYRRLGFDVLAMPCLNYGTMVESTPSTWLNTAKFAEKASVCGGLGTINTQWACFRTPVDGVWHGVAMTAQSTWFWPPADLADFRTQFNRLVLGMNHNGLSDALDMIAEGVGFRARGNRPFNLLHYAVMDTELHYHEGMEQRKRQGSSPDLDLPRIVREKLLRIAELPDRGAINARTDWVGQQVADALDMLKTLRPKTAIGRRVKDLVQVSGEFKLLRCATMSLLRCDSEAKGRTRPARAELEAALRAERRLRNRLRAAYARYLAPGQLDFELGLLFDGEETVLRERIAARR